MSGEGDGLDEKRVDGNGTSVLMMTPGDTETYEWKFLLPPRSVLLNNFTVFPALPHHEFGNLKFTTGLLKDVDHSLDLRILRNFNIYMKLKIKNTDELGFFVMPCELYTMEGEAIKGTSPFNLSVLKGAHPLAFGVGEWETTNQLVLRNWDENVDSVKIILKIRHEPLGKCVNLPSITLTMNRAFQKYFLSESLADVALRAGDKVFAAHRVILSGRSPVFERMFENPMKEAKEGVVDVKDVEPEVLKELLHFIYTCEFSGDNMSEALYVGLFKAADKYSMEDLKLRCAKKIEETLSADNAVEIYMLGDIYGESKLMDGAFEIMKRNKAVALKDPETVQELAARCPNWHLS